MSRNIQKEKALDAYLVLRAQAGNADAFDQLYRRWYPKLLAHASRVLGSREQAQDAVQDAAVTISSSLRSLKKPESFAPWAFQITTRRCHDFVRRAVRNRDIAAAASDFESLETDGAEVLSVRQAIGRLAPQDQSILALFYTQGLTLSEIAIALDIPIGTAKSRLFSARQHLKTLYEGDDL